MNDRRFICLLGACTFSFFNTYVYGQNIRVDSLNNKLENQKIIESDSGYPKVKFGGLFQGRFVNSLDNDIDIDGQPNFNREGVLNTFQIKYARVQMRAHISKRTEIFVLANLADQNKILENASITYKFSPKLKLQLGQFRPWFGIEEATPVEIIKSLEWSNQYNEFGKLGWTSFQIGAAILGESKIGNIPYQYSVSLVNGNGRNQLKDNDSGKLLSSRIHFNLLKNNLLNIGINGGLGESHNEKINAYAADISTEIPLNNRWNVSLALEAKNATNHILYHNLDIVDRKSIDDYQIRGFYILPDFKYTLTPNSLNITTIEFSCRYEILNNNYKNESNPKETIMPMIGLEFLKNYGARIQMGAKIDRYKYEDIDQKMLNNNLLILQVQTRF